MYLLVTDQGLKGSELVERMEPDPLVILGKRIVLSERETIPPSAPRSTALFSQLAVPDGYRPRGSAIAA
jgi:hypothetical protein